MSGMVRKQIYLEKRQVLAIQQRARAVGANESELIRQAIDHELYGSGGAPTRPDPSAWDEVEAFLSTRSGQSVMGEPYQFDRQELYEERLKGPDGSDSD